MAATATTPRGVVRHRRRRWPRIRRTLTGLAFCAPAIVGLLLFNAYPILASFYYSFTDYSIIGTPYWVGWENYRELFTYDPVFWEALGNTLYWVVIAVPLGVATAFTLACLLNLPLRGLPVLRMIFFLPSIVPLVASSMIWLLLLNPQFGLINSLLNLVGISGPGWLADPQWAKPALVLTSLWGVGGSMLIFLSGLQDVPKDFYEAAELDGASVARRFFDITIPMMGPYILFSVITGLIGAFQYFTQAQVLTGGGPGDATRFYSLYLYENAFEFYRLGYASAMAWLLFLLIAAVSFVVFRTSAGRVYYGGQS